MERKTSLNFAKEIMGSNFIGIEELISIQAKLGIWIPENVVHNLPEINFDKNILESKKDDYLLILYIPFYVDKTNLSLVKMREHLGVDPSKNEPCFYNQDWYLKEPFANEGKLEMSWLLVKKNVIEEYRGKNPKEILEISKFEFPSALLLSYTFFANYLINNEILWKYDYVWCKDNDSSGDQIYVGKYLDINGINKNGFEVHRHLSIKYNYSFVEVE